MTDLVAKRRWSGKALLHVRARKKRGSRQGCRTSSMSESYISSATFSANAALAQQIAKRNIHHSETALA
jgi:hypothetical protein